MVLVATCFCFRATIFCQPSPTILQYVVLTPDIDEIGNAGHGIYNSNFAVTYARNGSFWHLYHILQKAEEYFMVLLKFAFMDKEQCWHAWIFSENDMSEYQCRYIKIAVEMLCRNLSTDQLCRNKVPFQVHERMTTND